MKDRLVGETAESGFTKIEIDFLRESNAIEGVFDTDSLSQAKRAWRYIKNENSLSTGTILQTHKILMLNTNLLDYEKGEFRQRPAYVGNKIKGYHKTLPWGKIPSAMERWMNNMNRTIDSRINSEELNRKLHIKYEKIHPFIDGNGRTGRIFMNWWRLRNELPILVINNSEKQVYYAWFST